MSEIIKLLPDSIANQIAAGEVIQRPASVVKELVENAVDANATQINIVIKDAGKSLVQVIDNGMGMSPVDARMSLERHATSKIEKAEDLFHITTKGFRGEAMASIASISHLEVKSKQESDEVGTRLVIEGSVLKEQIPCSHTTGTTISVKNLFYNVPARRKFLKSDRAEFRNIIDEFQRVAIAHPAIGFKLIHNENEIFNLKLSNQRQRIVSIFGNKYNQNLVPIEEDTNLVKISGFVGKPETAKKTRGEQFLFVNNRYIKSAYFNQALVLAYESLIPEKTYPSYFLLMEVDPKTIDVNIHPTKTEVKFENEKEIFIMLKAACKKSLGQFNIAPSLDFSGEFNIAPPNQNKHYEKPGFTVNTSYNPFEISQKSSILHSSEVKTSSSKINWDLLYENELDSDELTNEEQNNLFVESSFDKDQNSNGTGKKEAFQLQNKYIVSSIKSGLIVIHQQRAHQRVLYEKYRKMIQNSVGIGQQLLFPENLELSVLDSEIIEELLPDLNHAGVLMEGFGKNSFIIRALPTEANEENPAKFIDGILEIYKKNQINHEISKKENLAISLAQKACIKVGQSLKQEEIDILIDELFACEMPYSTPTGKPTINTLSKEDLDNLF